MQEPHRLERAVVLLVAADPVRRVRKHGVVHVDQPLSLRERLQHESGQPQAAGLVAVAESREAAIRAPVGQLALVARRHQMLRLRHDFGLYLSRLFEITGDEHVGREQYHVLLAASERHLKQIFKPLYRLAQVVAAERDDRARRAVHRPGRRLDGERPVIARRQDDVLHELVLHPFRLYDDGLYHRVRGVRAPRCYLDWNAAQLRHADAEIHAAHVGAADRYRLLRLV